DDDAPLLGCLEVDIIVPNSKICDHLELLPCMNHIPVDGVAHIRPERMGGLRLFNQHLFRRDIVLARPHIHFKCFPKTGDCFLRQLPCDKDLFHSPHPLPYPTVKTAGNWIPAVLMMDYLAATASFSSQRS